MISALCDGHLAAALYEAHVRDTSRPLHTSTVPDVDAPLQLKRTRAGLRSGYLDCLSAGRQPEELARLHQGRPNCVFFAVLCSDRDDAPPADGGTSARIAEEGDELSVGRPGRGRVRTIGNPPRGVRVIRRHNPD